jgi:hypothetical protein
MKPFFIPVKTIWDNQTGGNPSSNLDKKSGMICFTFHPFYIPDKESYYQEYGNNLDVFGYNIELDSIDYDKHGQSLKVYLNFKEIPEGTTDVVPIALILGCLALIGVGIVGIELLTKIQGVFKMPVIYLVLAVALVIGSTSLVKAVKS